MRGDAFHRYQGKPEIANPGKQPMQSSLVRDRDYHQRFVILPADQVKLVEPAAPFLGRDSFHPDLVSCIHAIVVSIQ
jgi:hypothetical protein